MPTLAAVVHDEAAALFRHELRGQAPGLALKRLDFQHVGARLRQQRRTERGGDDLAAVKHMNAVQSAGGHGNASPQAAGLSPAAPAGCCPGDIGRCVMRAPVAR